jgi:hypothetical protein
LGITSHHIAHTTSIIQLGGCTRSVLDSRSPLTAANFAYFLSVLLVCHIMMSRRCTYRTAFSQIDLPFLLSAFSDDLFDFTFLRRKLTKFRYGGIFDSFIQSSFLHRKEGLGFYRRLVLFPRHGLGNGVPSLSFTGLVDTLSSTISLARESGIERIETILCTLYQPSHEHVIYNNHSSSIKQAGFVCETSLIHMPSLRALDE